MTMQDLAAREAITPLRLRAIGKRFGRLAVLRGVDLEVRAGEVVGLVGANGAGKTTLLSIVAGLEQPTEGEQWFGAEARASAPDLHRRARMALVTHTAQVYPRLTARENLELFVDLRRAAGFDAADPDPLLVRLGLADARERMAETFSRGMLQRLALARALLGRPDLLLLDEPFTALDRPGRALLSRVILEERDRGAAVLLSSHDFDAIGATTDRVVLLEGGRLVGVAERNDAGDPDGADYRARVQGLAGRLPHAEVARA
jgi:ABC-type multidrug transport system ATPase subunit